MDVQKGDEAKGLKVLAADEDQQALEETAAVLRELGHEVTACAVRPSEAADEIAREDPDVAVVVVHDDDEHALDLIAEIGEFASGPVIALLETEDPAFVRDAAERGIFAYARPITSAAVQSAFEVAMRRHAEQAQLTETVDQLENALARRGIIERAKGILMERHSIDERAAFEMLRGQARATNRSVIDLARAVSDGHALLPKQSG